MKVSGIIFDQVRTARLGDMELPEPTERDILVETEVSGVSVGTERWAFLGKRKEITFPNVPGYMTVGRIAKAGALASDRGWKEGDRVYFFASRLAGGLQGKSWMAGHLAMGVVDVCGSRCDGDLQIHHCERVPDGLSPEDAVLCGLAGVALRGIEMAVVRVGAQVLVCGLGIIGQFAAQICKLKGALVTVADLVEQRVKTAKALGADHCIASGAEPLSEAARAISPEGYDIVIDTSGSVQVVNSLFPLLKLGGKFVFQGWYPPPSPLDLDAIHQRLATAFFPCAHTGQAVAAALGWAASGKLKIAPLVTHRFEPEDCQEMYELIAAGSENFLGMLVDWRRCK